MRSLIPLALLWAGCLAQTSSSPQPSAAPSGSGSPPAPIVKPEDKCEVQGTVVNALTGEPLNKSHLMLRPLGQQSAIPYSTTTDQSGHFLLDDIDPGRYTFSASRNGFVNQSYSPDGNLKHTTTLTLANGQKIKEIVFKLTPQGVIAGRVVDQDGEPLARVRVVGLTVAYRNGKRETVTGGSSSTNDLGEYRMFGLRPGKYIVAASYQSNPGMAIPERSVGSAQALQAADEGYAPTYYPNSTAADGASRIEIIPGAQILGIDMKLVQTKTYRIKGRVTAGGGSPPLHIGLMMIPRESGVDTYNPRYVQIIDPKGSFEIRGVSPGSYVFICDYNDADVTYNARVPVDVGNANVEGIEIPLLPPVEVDGHVVVEDNGDLKGANLSVSLQPKTFNPMRGGGGGPVKDDLTFKLTNVARDVYDVGLFRFPEGFYVKSVHMGDQDVTLSGVDLTQGPPASDLVIFLNPNGGQVEGTVQNAEGGNAAGATVTLIPDESRRAIPGLYKTANTDQNGHFSIKGISPGQYKIYAWEEIESGAYQDPEFVKPHESAGKAVTIKEKSHETIPLDAIPAETSAVPK